jgi:RIO kinase 1
LLRLRKAGIRAPEPIVVRSHLLVMEFLGKDGWPAPRLKDAVISQKRFAKCYRGLVLEMRKMYHHCRLVHADLSEYNILYHNKDLYIIDVSQSVEHDHPHAMEFLRMDCANVTRFFVNNQVNTLRMKELFEFVSVLTLPDAEEAYLDSLLAIASTRPAMTAEELTDESIFAQIFIPRTLSEVADPEKDIAQRTEYLEVTGIQQSDLPGPVSAHVEEHDEEADSSGDHDEREGMGLTGWLPGSPKEAARTVALFCVACLPFDRTINARIAKLVWGSRNEQVWAKLHKRLSQPTKDDLKAERKMNKKAVKEEKRESRKTKIPKKVKKRALKVGASKKKK